MNIETTLNRPFGITIEAGDANMTVGVLSQEVLYQWFNEHHLVVLRGFQPLHSASNLVSFCNSLGEISLWPFGKVLELIVQGKPEDHIFDNSYMPFHWDGMYRKEIPEMLVFHAVKAPHSNQGGQTIFANTKSILESIPEDMLEEWKRISGEYHREMEFYKSRIKAPLIQKHPLHSYLTIRYGEPHFEEQGDFINPPKCEFKGLTQEHMTSFHPILRSLLYSEEHCYAHQWQDGDIVLADNFTLLHGRKSFKKQSSRHLHRVHILSSPPLKNPALETFE